MKPKNRNVYHTGWPMDVICVGPFWFTPWMERMRGRNSWRTYPGLWRSPRGERVTTEQIRAWAKQRHLSYREITHYPNLVDEDEVINEERILYGEPDVA